MILVRKDEAHYLTKVGLSYYIMGKTCYGKKFAVENNKVLAALRRYNASITVEG